jgi:hypothetical protein
VVHHGEGLALGAEALQDLIIIRADLNKLQGNGPLYRLCLISKPDLSHPTVA